MPRKSPPKPRKKSQRARRSALKPAAKPAPKSKPAPQSKPASKPRPERTQPVLLSGGNPQIAKADGDAPVQAYLAALPGWKRATCARLDALIVRTVPGVQKAVRWNSPFYGLPGQGWFLSVHAMTRYLKVAFLNGASLRPLPPIPSKHASTRYLHLFESDPLDEPQLTTWLQQAAALPGERCF